MKDGSKLFQTYLYILHVMRFAHFLQSTDCGTLAFLSPLWDLALSVRPAKLVQMTRGSEIDAWVFKPYQLASSSSESSESSDFFFLFFFLVCFFLFFFLSSESSSSDSSSSDSSSLFFFLFLDFGFAFGSGLCPEVRPSELPAATEVKPSAPTIIFFASSRCKVCPFSVNLVSTYLVNLSSSASACASVQQNATMGVRVSKHAWAISPCPANKSMTALQHKLCSKSVWNLVGRRPALKTDSTRASLATTACCSLFRPWLQ